MRIAALTMVYNEPVWAGVWARHYARVLGAEHCYMLDHGTDDRSLDRLGVPVRVEPLGRSPLDEEWRLAVVTERVRRLLRDYDAVLHTDADELIVGDPDLGGLAGVLAGGFGEVVTAAGLDVQHLPGEEPPLDLARPIAGQRRWVRFAASMCKPALVRREVAWSPGFHSCDAPLVFDGLYLLHMRYADLGLGLARLARTRAQAFADPATAAHQRVDDDAFETMMRRIATLPRRPGPVIDTGPPLDGWLARMHTARAARAAERYKIDFDLVGDELWDGTRLLAMLGT